MPERMITENDPLAAALPQFCDDVMADPTVADTVSVVSDASTHTVQLYDDVSDDDFSDANSIFVDEVARLEREYFDSLHVVNTPENVAYGSAGNGVPRTRVSALSAFEKSHFHAENVTPERPCLAFFKTDSFMPASEIFEALATDGFHAEHVRCLQHKPSGEVFLTFRKPTLRDSFFHKSSFVMRRPGQHFVPNTGERNLTFLTVYDALYELPDTAIIHRLSPFCEVVWHRRGTFRSTQAGGVFNGVLHYRVRVHHAIPSFLRFGKFLVRLYHDGQLATCRKCNRPDHKAAECHNIVSFNCDGLGHQARECIKPMYCCICKSGQHLARRCPLFWHRDVLRGTPPQGTVPPSCDVPHAASGTTPGELWPEDSPSDSEGRPSTDCPVERPATVDPEVLPSDSDEPSDESPDRSAESSSAVPQAVASPSFQPPGPDQPASGGLESGISAGGLGDSSNGTSFSSSLAPVLDSQGLLLPSPVLSLVPSSVSVPVSIPESVPVFTAVSAESSVSSDVVLSTASWADIVDRVAVPPDPPASFPVMSSGRPSLSPRPPGRVS